MTIIRTLISVAIAAIALVSTACDADFHLSEAETAAYANLFINESSANDFTSGLTGQILHINFNPGTSPPALTNTDLVPLLSTQTTLGGIDAFNNQVDLQRLNSELQTQIENYVHNRLDLYNSGSSADVKLTGLSFINITFANAPTFTYQSDRQTIAFNANLRMGIGGTIRVDALDWFSNLIFGVNGSYPLLIEINNLNLNGEVILSQAFADASQITLKIRPTVGTVGVSDTTSLIAPNRVKNGVAAFMKQQLSQPLSAAFVQRYDYFSLTGVSLVPSTAQPPLNLRYKYNAIPDTAKPMMHIVARAADGKLYHQQKTEGGQNIISSTLPFPSLQTRVENEPSLYASATDQLELAATTVTGQLVYSHYRDEAWGLQTTITPSTTAVAFRGKPAIIASAPGQVEIIVAAQNGSLWHVRRINSVWTTPVAVPVITLPGYRSPPYRDPVVALSGNKVVVAFIDMQNRLNASVFDLESGLWGQASPVQTASLLNASYGPAIAATGNGRVELVYVAQNNAPYHRVLSIDAARFAPNVGTTGMSIVDSEVSIGGTLSATPALVCSSYKQLELIGRGMDTHLYHNHFVGPDSPGGFVDGRSVVQGWQGWTGMSDNFSGTLTFGSMSSFTAAATSTGKIGVVSITTPTVLNNSPEQYLYHNTYDATRYGTQPWKTVGWRGAERIMPKRFIGQPSLAMTERNISLSYVNNDFVNVQRARLTDADFFQPSSYASNTSVAAAAAAVSSLPNYTDIIVAGYDSQIRHLRCKDRDLCSTRILPQTPFRSYRYVSVVGYGNGYLDVVASTNEGHPYHWRFQNGVWSAGTDLSPSAGYNGPVALVNLGAGRLGLILVNTADNPAVSYLANGVWSAPRLFTNFPIQRGYFGAQTVKSWGDGTFDYAFVRSPSRDLWQGRMGPREYTGNALLFNVTPGRAPVSIGGVINDMPVLTVFSPTRMHIIAEGMDNRLYYNWSRLDPQQIYNVNYPLPIVWTGFGGMSGNNLRISDVAKTAGKEMSVVATDSNGNLFMARYTGAAWPQFQPLMTTATVHPSVNYSPMLTTY